MEYEEIENILYRLVTDFLLRDELSVEDKEMLLISSISMDEVLELKSDFLADTYFALKHSDEELCKTSKAELIYLKECFEKKRTFSRTERDKFIEENI